MSSQSIFKSIIKKFTGFVHDIQKEQFMWLKKLQKSYVYQIAFYKINTFFTCFQRALSIFFKNRSSFMMNE